MYSCAVSYHCIIPQHRWIKYFLSLSLNIVVNCANILNLRSCRRRGGRRSPSPSTWHPIRRHSLVSTKKEKMSRSALSTRSHHPIVGAVLSIDILTSPSAVTIASASNYSPHIIYNVDETNLHPHCFNILCM